jgi:hypothetical protein
VLSVLLPLYASLAVIEAVLASVVDIVAKISISSAALSPEEVLVTTLI